MQIKKYKGYSIEFDYEREVFIGALDGERHSDSSFSKLKEKIDKALKQNLGNVQVYCNDSWRDCDFKIWKVTSKNIDEGIIWLSRDGLRQKTTFGKVYIVNDLNGLRIKELKELSDTIKILQEKERQIEESLEKYV